MTGNIYRVYARSKAVSPQFWPTLIHFALLHMILVFYTVQTGCMVSDLGMVCVSDSADLSS